MSAAQHLGHGSSTFDVISVDLSDDETESEVVETLEEVRADPPEGLEQDVVNALDKTVAADREHP